MVEEKKIRIENRDFGWRRALGREPRTDTFYWLGAEIILIKIQRGVIFDSPKSQRRNSKFP